MFETANYVLLYQGQLTATEASKCIQSRGHFKRRSSPTLPIRSQHIRNMGPVTGTLQSGTYVVSNVASHNYATLKDANKGSPITANNNARSQDVKVC
jgi:hypothetical protein